ncbi:MAG: ribbon-helix-helix domain-containing protein [Verrucomicrobiota bacterium]|nr:ribbon-helix-helix domain-containing protein [Verrucomicrobiota bacterium]
MKTLTLKVPDNLFAEIASDARARNLSKSEIVRERLTRKPVGPVKSANASLWSRMADLVIQHDSLPSDLSTNKIHLKGYGKSRSHR